MYNQCPGTSMCSLFCALLFVSKGNRLDFFILCTYKIYHIKLLPVIIVYKSIAGHYWPVNYPDGPIMACYRFIKNAYGAVPFLSFSCLCLFFVFFFFFFFFSFCFFVGLLLCMYGG